MTRASGHDPGQEPRAPGEHDPHGIVEEFRHEVEDLREGLEHAVEEAVEHVPKPVRWTVRKLILIIALAIVGVVVIAVVSVILYFANRTELVAREATLLLNGALAQHSDVQIEIGDLRGNPLRGFRLLRSRVRFVDGKSPALLEAPWIEIQYSPLQWLGRAPRSVDVTIEAPVVRLANGANGRIRLPAWRTSGPTGAGNSPLDIHLRIHHGSVVVPLPLAPVRGLEVEARASTARGTAVEVRRLTWMDGPYFPGHLELSGSAEGGDTVRLRLTRLRSDDVAVRGEMSWARADSIRHLHLELERVSWRWLARITGNKSFDVPGTGRAVFDGSRKGAWEGRFSSEVTWSDLPAQAEGNLRWDGEALTVKPLHLTSAAGELHGDLGWSRAGWEVGGDVVHGHPEQWKSIGISGWPKGDVAGEFRYAVDTSHRGRASARLIARLGASELAGWRADEATVRVEFPAASPDTFRVDAQRRGGTFSLLGWTTAAGWSGTYRASDFPLDEWPDGRASGITGVMTRGEGSVEGRNGGLFVTGELAGASTTWLGMRSAVWELHGVSGALLPQPDLVARARLGDVMFLGVHFDSAATPFTLHDRWIALEDVRAAASDTTLTLAGRADWDTGTWRMSLDRAAVRSRQFDWTAAPPVRFSGDSQGVNFDRLAARDSDATLAMSGRWAGPGGSYDWTAHAEQLDLGRLGLPIEWHLSGAASATVRVTGAAGNPRWSVDAAATRPGWQGHSADSLRLELAGSPATLDVRRAWVRLQGGTAEAKGSFEQTANPWPDTLTATGVRRWLAGAARWNAEVTAAELPLDALRDVAPAARDWGGRVGGKITVSGSPQVPVLDASVTAHPLTWQAISAEDLKCRAHYAAGQLEITELRVSRGGRESIASGHMPLVLALDRNAAVPETPMAWRVDIPNGDLSFARLLVPQIGSAAGRFDLRANVAGTPRHPDLDGTMTVAGGKVRMAGREELFEDVAASLRLDEHTITVDTLSARQGTRGRVTGHGSVQLADGGLKGYQFHLNASELTTTEPGLYAALFDGRFTVTDGPLVHGQRVPFVTGTVDVRRAVILYDFANVSETEVVAQTATPLYWTYRIRLLADNNVRWQPPDGDIEFSVNLDVEQAPDALAIYGDMKALRGTYYFLSNRFDIGNVDLTFDNVSGVNPQIDATAVTRVVPSTAGGGDLPGNITVHIHGRAREPLIDFSSDRSDWDQAAILQQLTLERFLPAAGGGVLLGDPLDNYITRAVNRTLSSEMSRAFRGYISEWQIDRQRGGLFGDKGDFIVGVGTQVTPKLSLRYRQRVPGLGSSPSSGPTSIDLIERDIEAEYRLSRFIYVTSELKQRRPGGSTPNPSNADFNINLKARWEY